MIFRNKKGRDAKFSSLLKFTFDKKSVHCC